jgi:hypothetical protein
MTPFVKYGTALATVSPSFSATLFAPASASDWRMETISLPVASDVLIKFRHTSDYENEMYIDDINITGAVGINDLNNDHYIAVFPNPSAGAVNVYVGLDDSGRADVAITNVMGEIIAEASQDLFVQRNFGFDLSLQSPGIYFVKVTTSAGSVVKKVIVNK